MLNQSVGQVEIVNQMMAPTFLWVDYKVYFVSKARLSTTWSWTVLFSIHDPIGGYKNQNIYAKSLNILGSTKVKYMCGKHIYI